MILNSLSRNLYALNTLLIFGIYSVFNKNNAAHSVLFRRFNQLGGVYVKFLQLLAMKDSTANTSVDLQVFDSVTFEPIPIYQLLHKELGVRAHDIEIIADRPFAAGSFAQVYRARYRGIDIVVKVKRPSISKHLIGDLALLKIASRLIRTFYAKSIIDIVTLFDDFAAMTRTETDYISEAKNAIEQYQKYTQDPVLSLPRTFIELCTNTIIVQEYVNGLALTDILKHRDYYTNERLSQEYRTDLRFVFGELSHKLLLDSISGSGAHGDPHPGNIYILPDNRIALIDFGIVSSVESNRAELRALLQQYILLYRGNFNAGDLGEAMARYFMPKLMRSLQTISYYYEQGELVQKLLAQFHVEAEKSFAKSQSDPSVSGMFAGFKMLRLYTNVINKHNRFNVRARLDSPVFFRSTQLFMQVLDQLDIDKRVLADTYERVLKNTPERHYADTARYSIEDIDESFYYVASWLENLQSSDPLFHEQLLTKWGIAV